MRTKKSDYPVSLAEILLNWYDRHARVMPWRVSPADRQAGVLPDPYHVWLSEVMLQQTTVVTVGPYFRDFISRWPTVSDLAAAEDDAVMAAWAGLGYYARARNLLKCARVVADAGGAFPSRYDALMKLPGIGPYTAAAVAAIAFDRAETVLDGNVERVMARFHAVEEPLPDSKETLRALAADKTPDERPGDYAQAVMDLGATICTPKSPACGICPWRPECAGLQAGIAETLPRKKPKTQKPTRYGAVYIGLTTAGEVMLEKRPDKGLLGGMMGFPGTAWAVEAPAHTPPFPAPWQKAPAEVRHVFTHFNLHLTVYRADDILPEVNNAYTLTPLAGFNANDLPTVFRKAWALGKGTLE